MLKEGQEERTTGEIEVRFSEEAYALLEEIAERTGKSIPDILRDALALEKRYEEVKEKGGRVLIDLDDGALRELLIHSC